MHLEKHFCIEARLAQRCWKTYHRPFYNISRTALNWRVNRLTFSKTTLCLIPISKTRYMYTSAKQCFHKPIFAHCKSGTRTAILWALVASRHRETKDVIADLRRAGQEIEFLEDELRESAAEVTGSLLRLKDDALLSLGRSKLLGGGQCD